MLCSVAEQAVFYDANIPYLLFNDEIVYCYECESYMELIQVKNIHNGQASCDECDKLVTSGYVWHCKHVSKIDIFYQHLDYIECVSEERQNSDGEVGYE